MFNYMGLLNPSFFPQQQTTPQGSSYWMQYAQPPQYLNPGANPKFAGVSLPPPTPTPAGSATGQYTLQNFRESPAYKAGQPVRVGNVTYRRGIPPSRSGITGGINARGR